MKKLIVTMTAVFILFCCHQAQAINEYVFELKKIQRYAGNNMAVEADFADEIESITQKLEQEIEHYSISEIEYANGIKVDFDMISAGAAKCSEISTEIENEIEENGISLNRSLNKNIVFACYNAPLNAGVDITIKPDAMKCVPEGMNIKLLIGEDNEALTLSNECCNMISTYNTDIVFHLEKDEDRYKLEFRTGAGKLIEKMGCAVRLSLPARNEGMTIYASYGDAADNWGGQYNHVAKVMEFETAYTGEYQVREAMAEIRDISELDDEKKTAIQFMTARGYFSLDDGKFKPDESLSRYEYTEALVRMFFAIDNDAVSDFSDVSKNTEFYRFVASSQQKNIVDGFEDGTFRGNQYATVEQVAVMAARTIADRLCYIYPSNPEKYLNFDGSETVSDWAKKEIALAAREKIIRQGDVSKDITRAQAAVILHRLFMLLYNTPSEPDRYSMELMNGRHVIWTDENAARLTVIIAVIDIIAIAAAAVVYMKKKRIKVKHRND